jgi:hypothetical protein
MLALEMEKSDVKNFMGRLLKDELFDEFEPRLIEIATNTKITIDGTNTKWGETRPLVYEIIKLSAKPKQIKIVFASDAPIHTNAAALFLNLVYENDSVTFTTATAQKEFALDKTLDSAWDNHISEFFSNTGIDTTVRE